MPRRPGATQKTATLLRLVPFRSNCTGGRKAAMRTFPVSTREDGVAFPGCWSGRSASSASVTPAARSLWSGRARVKDSTPGKTTRRCSDRPTGRGNETRRPSPVATGLRLTESPCGCSAVSRSSGPSRAPRVRTFGSRWLELRAALWKWRGDRVRDRRRAARRGHRYPHRRRRRGRPDHAPAAAVERRGGRAAATGNGRSAPASRRRAQRRQRPEALFGRRPGRSATRPTRPQPAPRPSAICGIQTMRTPR